MQFNRPRKHQSFFKSKKMEKQVPADEIATLALQHLADDPELLSRFLALTGLSANDLRAASTEPAFLSAVLDFFLGHEPSLMEFVKTRNISPESVVSARALLNSDEAQYD